MKQLSDRGVLLLYQLDELNRPFARTRDADLVCNRADRCVVVSCIEHDEHGMFDKLPLPAGQCVGLNRRIGVNHRVSHSKVMGWIVQLYRRLAANFEVGPDL